jgi:hypothetical protein
VTIGIFVDPGVVMSPGGDHPIRWNQSFEYDALGDRYAPRERVFIVSLVRTFEGSARNGVAPPGHRPVPPRG